MGLLATAGMISGMGQGLERGLANLQSGVTAYGLQGERLAHDDAARADDRAFQTQKLKEQMAHADALADKQNAFTSGEHQKDRDQKDWHEQVREGEVVNREKLENEKRMDEKAWRDAQTEQGGKKLDHEIANDKEKNRIAGAVQETDAKYKAKVGDYYANAKGSAKDAKAYKDLSDTDKEHFHSYQNEAKDLMELASKADPGPERDAYVKAAEKARVKGRKILGEEAAPKGAGFTYAPGMEPGGEAPPPPSPSSKKAPAAPAAPGLLSQARPPVTYDQRAREQLKDPRFDQFMRWWEQPAGDPSLPSPGVTLPNAH